jgi:hypothetical protein
VRSYLEDLVERLADRTKLRSSSESVSWAAHREAEQLADITMVGELAAAVRSLPTAKRSGCYFTIGKIGRNLRDEQCAAVLLDLLPAESNKYNLDCLLQRVGEIPKGPTLDLSAVFPLLEDKRWLVRHAAIRALDHSASPDVEARLVEHLSATTDAYDQTYCHAVLNHVGTRRALPAIEANLKSRKRDAKVSAELAVRAIRDRYPD